MKQEPFRITLEHYDMKIIIEKPYSDIDAEQLKEVLRTLCLAAGFSEQTINEMFGE
jgi:hypothetical protein